MDKPAPPNGRTRNEKARLTMGLLDGKRLLVTGVLTKTSIAFAAARIAQEEGAEIVLSSFGRALSITNRIAARLPKPAPVVELDVIDASHLESLAEPWRCRLLFRYLPPFLHVPMEGALEVVGDIGGQTPKPHSLLGPWTVGSRFFRRWRRRPAAAPGQR
jgi:hypothetical protein